MIGKAGVGFTLAFLYSFIKAVSKKRQTMNLIRMRMVVMSKQSLIKRRLL